MSSPPIPSVANQDPLFKARGDISAGEIKIFKDIVSVEGQADLLLSEKEAEEVFNLTEGDRVEIGPFKVISLCTLRKIFAAACCYCQSCARQIAFCSERGDTNACLCICCCCCSSIMISLNRALGRDLQNVPANKTCLGCKLLLEFSACSYIDQLLACAI